MNNRRTASLIATAALLLPASAQEQAPNLTENKTPATRKMQDAAPAPTLENVRYGPHERQTLDFWKAESAKPTPVMFYIHGGGWVSGDKSRVRKTAELKRMLASGISVVSINYRLIDRSGGDNETPPVKAPLDDAARALQSVRSKAGQWNIDKLRIGAAGGSAGACSSLWLAFRDDMADPASVDPVARESTRLWCVAVEGAQTTLDPEQMKEWTPNSRYGGHAFGKKDFAEFLESRDEIIPWIRQYSPYEWVSKDDPPVWIHYKTPPAMGRDEKDPTHTANFGIGLKQRCDAIGMTCHIRYPKAEKAPYRDAAEFLIKHLLAP